MTDAVIRTSALSKTFKVWKQPSDMLAQVFTSKPLHTNFKALDDVSFEVPRGSVVGVLGRNGAGKSTLLRVVAGTLEPSGGTVHVDGRVSAILELGTGFHPEYSGRDNVYLGGLCLGLTKTEVEERFDAIVDFAEMREFIDQPFRTYSSGMQARLTFAVATSVDADVFIVDEALAVGDAQFALKSFERIQDFRRNGKAILLVSHDINTVNSFCDHAILLERGQLIASGDPRTVGNIYHEMLFEDRRRAASQASRHRPPSPPGETVTAEAVATEKVRPVVKGRDSGPAIIQFIILDADGQEVSRMISESAYGFAWKVDPRAFRGDWRYGVTIRTTRGTAIFRAESPLQAGNSDGQSVTVTASFRNNLAPGTYFLNGFIRIDKTDTHEIVTEPQQILVDVVPGVYSASLANLQMEFSFASRQLSANSAVCP